MSGRLRLIGQTLDQEIDWASLRRPALYEKLAEVLGKPNGRGAYLVLGVLEATIPAVGRVESFAREWSRDGVEPLMKRIVGKQICVPWRRHVSVRSDVIIDVSDTSTSEFTTGIQRVARETIKQWCGRHDFTLVRWHGGNRILRELTPNERARVVGADSDRVHQGSRGMIVPFDSTLVLPEIAVDRSRADRIRSIALFGCSRSVAIGFDCIPVTTAETAGEDMPGAFSRYLSSLAQFSEVVAISSAPALEFAGWKQMLAGAGLDGPEIRELSLPFDAGAVDEETVRTVQDQLGLTHDTVVLSVGSHEPRKNHLTLLHAAELCWRAGHEFTLVFAGSNSWNSKRFFDFASRLQNRGRKIVLVSGVDDSVIWSLYSIAKVSVFCSFNEGFGLPVVESLAIGTPVITSSFGSMKELGEGHGALTVDPKDPAALAAALHRIFSEETLYERLLAETATLPRSTWADYARQLWNHVEPFATDAAVPPNETPRKGPSR